MVSSAAARARRVPELEIDLRDVPRLRREVERRVLAAVAGDVARHVVVGEHPGRRRADGRVVGERRVDGAAHPLRIPRAGEEVEVERRVQLVRAQVVGEALDVGEPELADEDARAVVAVGDRPPGAVDVVQLVAVDERVRHRLVAGLEVREGRVLVEQRRGVDAHACGAAVEPEAQDVLVLALDVRVVPVEVGLLGREEVQVPLAGRPVGVLRARPGAAAEDRLPVVRRQLALGAASRPKPEALPRRRAGSGRERLLEPRVLVGDVVRDDVDDDRGSRARAPRRSAAPPRPASRTSGRCRGSRRRRSRRRPSGTGTRG